MAKIQYKISYKTSLEGSVYTALEQSKKLYVGGSDWDRRKVLYTKNIAKAAKGIVRILEGTSKGFNNFNKKKEIFFPHMVYVITELPNKKLFIGCKSIEGSLNIINLEGNIIKQKDDPVGKGVYDAIFNNKEKEIVVTTRSGKLELIDPTTLEIKKKLQLAKAGTRLWPVALDEKDQRIYVGDYDGNLYIVDRDRFTKKNVTTFDLKNFYTGDRRLKEGISPSLWGLEVTNKNIFLGSRWGDVFVLDSDLNINKRINIGEAVTCIKNLSSIEILVGSRYGKLFELNIQANKLTKIIEIKPVLQKENAIWGMEVVKDGILVCFADGIICKIVKCYI